MPPSTHYLNLLNLNPSTSLENEVFSQEDIQRELEMFTNSQFLDDNALFDGYDGFTQPALPLQNHGSSSHSVSPSADVKPGALRQVYPLPVAVNLPDVHDHLFNVPAQSVDFAPQLYSVPPSVVGTPQHVPLMPHSVAGSDDGRLKRKAEDHDEDEDAQYNGSGRTVEEEDKRRRNTAASARFRIKKKQREQALQESAKHMTEKCSTLENRVKELELENKWLRSLLKPVDAKQASSAMSALKGQVLSHVQAQAAARQEQQQQQQAQASK